MVHLINSEAPDKADMEDTVDIQGIPTQSTTEHPIPTHTPRRGTHRTIRAKGVKLALVGLALVLAGMGGCATSDPNPPDTTVQWCMPDTSGTGWWCSSSKVEWVPPASPTS